MTTPTHQDAAELTVLVTAGPTREPIDDVRFLSNRSTGRMGIAIARAFAVKGHRVTLVLGPTEAPVPDVASAQGSIDVVRVESAVEMFDAVAARFDAARVFVAAAAVADFRPATRHEGKLKKQGDGASQAAHVPASLELVPNPDILLEMGRRRRPFPEQVIVGFALEVDDALANARGKLVHKRCDLICLNTPANFGEHASPEGLTLVDATGVAGTLAPTGDGAGKDSLADQLVEHILSRLGVG